MLVEDFAVATPEKTVLDTLHLRKAVPAADELDWEAVDKNTMRTMARSFPLSVTRRLEALLGRE